MWAFNGIDFANDSAELVCDYQTRAILSKIGYSFNEEELSDFEVGYLTLVHSEFERQRIARDKRKAKGM